MKPRTRHQVLAPLVCIVTLTGPAVSFAAPPCTDNSRACMISAATAYLDGLVRHDGSGVPFAPDARRTEQGNVTATGIEALRRSLDHEPPMKRYSNARFFVDTDRHEVIYFALLHLDIQQARPMPSELGRVAEPGPVTVHLAERFKVEHGQIEEIEAVFYRQEGTDQGTSGWKDE